MTKRLLAPLALTVFSALFAAPAPKVSKDAELFDPVSRDPKRCENIMPPGVKTIACIAPGSHPGSRFHRLGIELLRQAGYKVKVMPNTFKRRKEVAQAPLAGRLSDFYQAWNDPEVDMIFCVRGGRGCEEVMDNIDWKKLKKRPELYFQGYSDVTMITSALLKKGYGHPVAGPSAGGLSGATDDSLDAMRKIYHGEQLGPVKVKTLVPGNCKGMPWAGLLQRSVLLTGKDYCPPVKGRILFIEAVGIHADLVRKQLYQLLEKKFFDGVAGVVFCQFARCKPAGEIQAILQEIAPKLGVPVYANYPFGHTARSYCIDFTRPVEIKDGQVIFPAVK